MRWNEFVFEKERERQGWKDREKKEREGEKEKERDDILKLWEIKTLHQYSEIFGFQAAIHSIKSGQTTECY